MTYSNEWLRLREDLTNPTELSAARREALVAVKAWAEKWRDRLPAPAVAELAAAVGGVVTAHGGKASGNRIDACRREGRAGSVQELGDCMQERKPDPDEMRAFLREGAPHLLEGIDAADDDPPRRGLAEGSAWTDFLRTSGDVREGETQADATRRVVATPQTPASLAEELLRG
jgi:hypothetical protein